MAFTEDTEAQRAADGGRGASGSSVHQRAQERPVSLHKGSAVRQCLYFTPPLAQTCTLPLKVRTSKCAVPRVRPTQVDEVEPIVQREVKDPLLEGVHDPPIQHVGSGGAELRVCEGG